MIKQQSIKYNYILNISRVGFGVLAGLLTMPYVNRLLGVESIGNIEYVNSIVTYFILFSALGIPMYGVREIANRRDDIKARSKFVLELLCILSITTFISYLLIFFFIINIESLKPLKLLITIMSSMIFFSNLGIEWFYQGIEDQKYITIRFFLVRIICLLLLFIFVRQPADYVIYSVILVLSTVGSNLFNLFNLRKHLNFDGITFRTLDFKSHLKPILTIFIASISVSIYIQLDTLMLGALSGSKSVGYYTMANKLVRFGIVFITSLGAVLLPRLSYLFNTDIKQYLLYINKTLNYFFIISLPLTCLFFMLANDFTLLMGGIEFLPSTLTMKILSPIILIVSIAYFLGYLVLYPQGKERIYTIAVILSALFSVGANFYVIPKFGYNGVAVVAVLSELIGIVVMMILYRKELLKMELLNKNLFCYLFASFIMIVVIFLISFLQLSLIYNLIISSTSGLLSFFGFLLLFKEPVFIDLMKQISNKLNINR